MMAEATVLHPPLLAPRRALLLPPPTIIIIISQAKMIVMLLLWLAVYFYDWLVIKNKKFQKCVSCHPYP